MSVEIIDGKPTLTYDLGDGPTSIQVDHDVTDGHWYFLQAARNYGNAQLNLTEAWNNTLLFVVRNYLSLYRFIMNEVEYLYAAFILYWKIKSSSQLPVISTLSQ